MQLCRHICLAIYLQNRENEEYAYNSIRYAHDSIRTADFSISHRAKEQARIDGFMDWIEEQAKDSHPEPLYFDELTEQPTAKSLQIETQ